ncbi:DUF6069 family protein [Umezawaea sp. Da 62-37]|uniref:DUF6069 family protein n=1 Tax=Umezawaea sp. Da 62-37 TaxID=3075927 RepID=UPI0028F6D3E2|nr:DUF6069 family protein [Umezawaea sp. Da 62-37]WNV85775.1 DUF6069 family protein [Umezawaea sp. Da 62-37]
MTDTSDSPFRTRHPAVAGDRTAIGLVLAVLVSVALNTAIALLANAALPAGGVRVGLTLKEYAPLTVAGILLGALAWYLVRRGARDPRAVLRVLVPAAVLVSLVPDFGILATGAHPLNSLALVAMHLVAAATTVPVLVKALPLPHASS